MKQKNARSLLTVAGVVLSMFGSASMLQAGTSCTGHSAEECSAYYPAGDPSIVNTLWGIANVSATPTWVTCPVDRDDPFLNTTSDTMGIWVVGWVSGSSPIFCQHRPQRYDGTDSFTYSSSLVGADVQQGWVSGPFSTPTVGAAYKSVLWCRLPPGAYLYYYHTREDSSSL